MEWVGILYYVQIIYSIIYCRNVFNILYIFEGQSGLFYGHGSGEKKKHYDLFGGASYGENGSNLRDPSIPPIFNIKCGDLYGDDKLTEFNFGSGNKFLKGGGIIVLYSISGSIIIEGEIQCNGMDGCSGGTVFLCASTIHIKKGGKIHAFGGDKTSFAGKGGDGIICLYTNNLMNDNDSNNDDNNDDDKSDGNESEYSDDYDKITNIEPVPYISVMNKGRKILNNKKYKKQNFGILINDYKGKWKKRYQRTELKYADEEVLDDDVIIEKRKLRMNVNKMVKWIINKKDKIKPNEIENIFEYFGIEYEITHQLIETFEKNRNIWSKTKYRDYIVLQRLILEMEIIQLIISPWFINFSFRYCKASNLFSNDAILVMHYIGSYIDIVKTQILPYISFKFLYQYLDLKEHKIVSKTSEFKFLDKSVGKKTIEWKFVNKQIFNYQLKIKIEKPWLPKTKRDKKLGKTYKLTWIPMVRNTMFSKQKIVSICKKYLYNNDTIIRCGLLKIEKYAILFPKDWDHGLNIGGFINIECNYLFVYGRIDVNSKGYFSEHGQSSYGKIIEANEHNITDDFDDKYYSGGMYYKRNKNKKLDGIYLYHGSGIQDKKYLRGGGIISIKADILVNYGSISSNGSFGSSGGSIFISAKKFFNYGKIEALGGNKAINNHEKGGHGIIAIYSDLIYDHGSIKPKPYIDAYNNGIKILNKRQGINKQAKLAKKKKKKNKVRIPKPSTNFNKNYLGKKGINFRKLGEDKQDYLSYYLSYNDITTTNTNNIKKLEQRVSTLENDNRVISNYYNKIKQENARLNKRNKVLEKQIEFFKQSVMIINQKLGIEMDFDQLKPKVSKDEETKHNNDETNATDTNDNNDIVNAETQTSNGDDNHANDVSQPNNEENKIENEIENENENGNEIIKTETTNNVTNDDVITNGNDNNEMNIQNKNSTTELNGTVNDVDINGNSETNHNETLTNKKNAILDGLIDSEQYHE